MRKYFYVGFALLFLVAFVYRQVRAESLVSTQDTYLNGTGGQKLTAASCTAAAAARWSGWIDVASQRNVIFDVTFVDANSNVTSLDVRCEASTSSATVADAGFDLPVIYATSSTATVGISSIATSVWAWKSTTGGAPGTSNYVLYIENIPAPFIECLWTCSGAPDAADTIGVFARGINP